MIERAINRHLLMNSGNGESGIKFAFKIAKSCRRGGSFCPALTRILTLKCKARIAHHIIKSSRHVDVYTS